MAQTPLAIVGMDAHFGTLKTLREYEAAIYAGGDGVLRMQEREWRVFLHDVVIDPSDFTNATVSKLARDVHNAQVEAAPRMHMHSTWPRRCALALTQA